MKNAVRFEEVLKRRLQDPKKAASYLTACFEERTDFFLQGLRDVVEAQGGITQTARGSNLNRENLYRLLSRRGNPRLTSLKALLSALGIKGHFSQAG